MDTFLGNNVLSATLFLPNVKNFMLQYNIKKKEEVQEAPPPEPDNPLMRKKKTPEELAREAEAEDQDDFTSESQPRQGRGSKIHTITILSHSISHSIIGNKINVTLHTTHILHNSNKLNLYCVKPQNTALSSSLQFQI